MRLAALVVLALSTSVARADAPKCPSAAARVVAHGVWLGVSGGARCFAPDRDGKIDPDVLEPGLAALAAAFPDGCTRSIEMAADPDIPYQSLITAMDLAIKAGLPDVGLTDPKDLSIKIDDSDALEKNARRCAAHPGQAPAPPGGGSAPSTPDLAAAPIVVLSTKDVAVDGKTIGDAKALARGTGSIPALVTALKAHQSGDKHAVIVQADHASDVALVNRVVVSAKQAGYDNVLFAVKNKP